MSTNLEHYAMIGDGQTVALVSKHGSIDWFCWPRFDSDACFAALLGTKSHGHWGIAPVGEAAVRQYYREDTLILETEYTSGSGTVRLTDFMPQRGENAAIIRRVTGVTGQVELRSALLVRSNYGALAPWFEPIEGGFAGRIGSGVFALRADVEVRNEDQDLCATFTVAEGECVTFVLGVGATSSPVPPPVDAEQALDETERFWRDWIGKFDKPCDWTADVKRSLITLKALIFQPTGGMVAAPTTSLPEKPGGALNWDYRFSWIRDASFTLAALLNAGFKPEAEAWRDWVLQALGAWPEEMRIMYRVDGSRHIPESEVEWLPGYNHSKPIHIGNAASTQHQADVYGELLDAMHLADQAGIKRTRQSLVIEARIAAHIEKSWTQPGAGLWEARGRPRHYVYSRAMAWVGIDRFLKSEELCDYVGAETVACYKALRDEIHADVCREGYHEGLGRFVEYFGGQTLDACLLLLPLVGFLPADDPRMAATITAIETELMQDGMVRRKPAQGMEPQGSFIACTLWLADCQNLQGRTAEARATLERVLAVASETGLLSEEYNVPGQHLAGNYPQALSHLAVVNTALGLCGPVLQRGGG
ncbi:MAG: glucoamylase [Acidocella sp. 20-63-7]|nr:MAG: glucoamylase [Acidocella sp. 20-63-7]